MWVRDYRGYHVVLAAAPEVADLDRLLEALKHPEPAIKRTLGGRGGLCRCVLPQIGSVVLKCYERGGLMRPFNRGHYLRLGASRPAREFKLLQELRELGVQAPLPVGYIRRGRWWYQGWLITREIAEAGNLGELAQRGDERLPQLTESLGRQVRLLIAQGLYHVDLHPGNVLVDQSGEVFILDFDKARRFLGPRRRLRDAYICRWRRAVLKHQLPPELSEYFSLALRRNP